MPAKPMSSVVEQLRRVTHCEAPTAPDGQLLQRFIAHGDREAVATLVHRHGAMVWGVCRRVLDSEHDAEDAFQATFLVLIRRASSVWPRDMVANWLYGVARQTALKARAMTAKRRGRERQLKTLELSVPKGKSADIQSLEEELSRLPEQYRTAIVLCDLEGRTRIEAARLLGWPEGTVAGRLARARKLLARRLAQRGTIVAAGGLAAVLSGGASACVPATVVAATITAVNSLAIGQTLATGVISGKVAALTEGVLKAMFLTKLKTLATTLVVLGVMGFIGSRMGSQTSLAQSGQDARPPGIKNALPVADRYVIEPRLQGVWKVFSLESDGAKARFENNLGTILPIDVPVSDMTWDFTDTRVTIKAGKHVATAVYSTDQSKDPHRLNLVFEVDLGNEDVERLQRITVHGIFALDRDRLTLCLGNASSNQPFRPLKFASTAGSSPTSFYVLARSSVMTEALPDTRPKATDVEPRNPKGEHAESLQDRAWRVLGLRAAEVRGDDLKATNEQLRGGLRIEGIRSESLVDNAGCRVGDVLVGLHHWEIVSLRGLLYCWDLPALVDLPSIKAIVVRDNRLRFLYLSRPEQLKSAVHVTRNFEVHAPDEPTAKLVSGWAEQLRKSQALAWLGEEMPAWQKRCQVQVQLTPLRDGSSLSVFSSDQNGPVKMELSGSHDGIRHDKLPLQIAHAIVHHDLGLSAPRWIGAGMGALDGSEAIRDKHMQTCRELFTDGKLIPLRKVLPATEFPRDTTAFYPQSYSLAQFLVERKDRATFLAFAGLGMRKDWDSALRRFYRLDGIDGLETAWQKSLTDKPAEARPAEAPLGDTIRGVIESVDKGSGLVQLSMGSESGLKESDRLEVYRLKPAPQYLGMIQIVSVQPRDSIARRITLIGRNMPLQRGDQVASRLDAQN